jgi:hypothetical protein
MVARKPPDQKTVEFDFVDNSGSTMPAYLHHFVLTILNADHHTEDWTFIMPGDKLLHAHSRSEASKGKRSQMTGEPGKEGLLADNSALERCANSFGLRMHM